MMVAGIIARLRGRTRSALPLETLETSTNDFDPFPEHLPKPFDVASSGIMSFEDGSWVDLANEICYFATPELETEMRRRLKQYSDIDLPISPVP